MTPTTPSGKDAAPKVLDDRGELCGHSVRWCCVCGDPVVRRLLTESVNEREGLLKRVARLEEALKEIHEDAQHYGAPLATLRAIVERSEEALSLNQEAK
jgi:hypothetical protein